MFAAFRMFFATLASLFSATQKLAASADHMASFVEGEAQHFNNKTTLVRVQEIKRLQSGYAQEDHDAALAEKARQSDLGKVPVTKAKAA
jgi:hypothetical protein